MSWTCARGSSSGSEAQNASSPSSISRRLASARRMSVTAFIHTIAWSWSSSTSMTSPFSSSSAGRPASSRVSITAAALPALPLRSSVSVNRRNSPAASSSSRYADGNSRASTGSSGTVVGPEKSSIASNGSTAVVGTADSLRSSSMICDASDRSRSASKPVNVATAPPLRRGWNPSPTRSALSALERGPQAVLVHRLDVALHLLARPRGHGRATVVVDLEHLLLGLLPGESEVLLEDERDVGHQVDRVVPHHRLPRSVGGGEVLLEGLLELDGHRCGHDHQRRRRGGVLR